MKSAHTRNLIKDAYLLIYIHSHGIKADAESVIKS